MAEQFYNCWLSRYPTPVNCIYDNGGKFIGAEFKDLLNRAGINKKPTTIKNPTANAICERMHDTIAMMLRTKSKTITEEEHAEQEVDNAISSCLHALHCIVNKMM